MADVGDAVKTALLDVTECLGDIGGLDDEGGLVVAPVLVGVLLAEEESEGPAADEVQPAKSSTTGAAAAARAAIAALLDRVFTLPFRGEICLLGDADRDVQ